MQQADDLRAEGEALYELLSTLDSDDWARTTPFKQYSAYDVVAHLHTTDHAATVALKQPDEFRAMTRARDPAIAITGSGARLPDLESGEALRERWLQDLNSLCDLLAEVDIKLRVPWFGPDMSVRMFASARQMETWSHGQDIYDLLHAPRTHTDRLRNIAQIGVRTYGWTFVNRNLEVPEPPPYVRLTAPSGEIWEWNEPDEANRIEGDAVQFCRVVTQGRNIADTALAVTGDTATRWMSMAQCFAGGPQEPPGPGERAWSE
mgnify:CR=1 FL=1|jgi:uncharacterized protein (TIGR03084 family)|tara:strand:- start:7605 stop:8390 length:786 start_codon:yes stop_codon:yes gene_type:complete